MGGTVMVTQKDLCLLPAGDPSLKRIGFAQPTWDRRGVFLHRPASGGVKTSCGWMSFVVYKVISRTFSPDGLNI